MHWGKWQRRSLSDLLSLLRLKRPIRVNGLLREPVLLGTKPTTMHTFLVSTSREDRHHRALASTLVLGFALLQIGVGLRVAAENQSPLVDAVAIVGGEPITANEFQRQLGNRLLRFQTEEFEVKRQVTEDLVAQRLITLEASRLGIATSNLLKQEVEGQVGTITESEATAAYEASADRYGGLSRSEALAQIQGMIRAKRVQQRRTEFLDSLRKKYGVRVLLEPPRVPVQATGPAEGPTNAPIVIVEFSDFQCPFCREANRTLDDLNKRYEGKVRRVFRNFPLLGHTSAPKAAEAAACAGDAGRFWEMHDRLFQNQSKLSLVDLKGYARDLGMDSSTFDACLDSGKHEATWRRDANDGESSGVLNTPSFFINGRLIIGAQPLAVFSKVVEEELQR